MKQEDESILECTAWFILKWDCARDEKTLEGRHRYRQKPKDDIADCINKWTWRGSQWKGESRKCNIDELP